MRYVYFIIYNCMFFFRVSVCCEIPFVVEALQDIDICEHYKSEKTVSRPRSSFSLSSMAPMVSHSSKGGQGVFLYLVNSQLVIGNHFWR